MQASAIGIVAFAIASLALPSDGAGAQGSATDVRIRLESSPGNPVAGALVALVDGDRVTSEGLSSTRGTVMLSAAAGTYRVRVRRIGYRPYVSEPFTAPLNTELLLKVETERVILDAMVVSAVAQCGAITSDAATLSAVWDEISKALRASQLTLADLNTISRKKLYRMELGAHGEVVSSDTTLLPVTTVRPFAAVDPVALARLGYVRGDNEAGWEYFGPDEAVLLSNDFAATHCFRVVRKKKRPGQIGVAFEPAPKRRVADIKGVLWVDEKTSELRDVGFVYVNAGMLTVFEPGGYTKFQRVPSGAWIVSDWQLKMPRLVLRPGAMSQEIVLGGYFVNGGLIVR